MTFNLAARQKPKDISPNRITACSSPSSHNFQLDSLTAALSAGSQPATALLHFTPTKSGGNVSPVRKSGPLKKKKNETYFQMLCIIKGRQSTHWVRSRSEQKCNAHLAIFTPSIISINFISGSCNAIPH